MTASYQKGQQSEKPTNEAAKEAAGEQTANAEHENLKDIAEQFKAAEEAGAPAESAEPSKDDQIAELKDQLLRSMAELENTRRRAKTQIEDASKYAVTKFARDMIDVLENLHRATSTIPAESLEADPTVKQISEGVELTKKTLTSIFERYGISRVNPEKGEPFDHNFHEAVAHVPAPGAEPGTVIDVVQAGYTLQDRLLRPAMVAVAKGDE